MRAKFIELEDKGKIITQIMSGDYTNLPTLIDEIDRLENLIKDYELGMESITARIETSINKWPNNIE